MKKIQQAADKTSMKTSMRQAMISLSEGEYGTSGISLAQIISSLSFALDLTEDAVPGHALRSCLIGMHIAERLGLHECDRSNLYYTLLLKDVGCSSNAARMCQIIGGGDDRAIKAGVKLEDWTRPHQPKLSAIKLLWNNVLPGHSSFAKTMQILRIGMKQHANNEEMIALRCDRGANIVRKIGLSEQTANGVRCLDEHWDGSGYPKGLLGTRIPIESRIACLAQHLDVFASEQSPEAALSTMIERSGRWFDPELVHIANTLHREGKLWANCWSEGHSLTIDAVMDMAPAHGDRLSSDKIDDICQAFSEVVDAKSPFTSRHSMGVTKIAEELGATMGFGTDRIQFIKRAGLLHDLGKLRVPNSILDKNGKPTAEEWTVVREHPALTRQILSRVRAFDGLAVIAGAHHEKLDGTGYPDRLTGDDIPVEARILAMADVFGALTEDRPYRAGLSLDEALAIIAKDIPAKLDPTCFEALIAMTEAKTEFSSPEVAQSAGMQLAFA